MDNNLDQMWDDLDWADQQGNDALARSIMESIKRQSSPEEEDVSWGAGRIAGARAAVDESAAAVTELVEPRLAALGAQNMYGRDLPGQPAPYFDVEKYKEDLPVQQEAFTLDDTYRADAKIQRAKQMASMPENEILKFGTELTDALVLMLPAILAAPVTGGESIPLALMAIPAFGTGYENARARMEDSGQEIDQSRAAFEGLVRSAYEIGPEKVFGVFKKAGISDSITKYFGTLLAKEAGSEAFTESLNMLYDKLQYDEFPDDWMQAFQQIGKAALMGVFLGGGISLPQIPGMKADMKKEEARVALIAQMEADIKADQERMDNANKLGDEFTDNTALKPTEFAGGAPTQKVTSISGMGTSQPEIISEIKDTKEVSALEYLEGMKVKSESSFETSIEDEIGLETSREANALQQQTQDQDAHDERQLGLLREAQRADDADAQPELDLPEGTYNLGDLKGELDAMNKGDVAFVLGRAGERVQRMYRDAAPEDRESLFQDIWEVQTNKAHDRYRQAIDKRYHTDSTEGGAEADLSEEESDARGYSEIERIDRLARNKTVAEKEAASIDAQITAKLPKLRDSSTGNWKLIAIEPEEGRLYAEWQGDAVTYGINWMPGDPSSQVHTLDKDGEIIRKGYGTRGLDRPTVPERIRVKFEQYSVAAFLTGDEVAKGGGKRQQLAGGIAQVPFRAALDPRVGAAKAGLKAVQELEQREGRYVKATPEQKLKAQQQAVQDAATAQKDMIEFVLAQYTKGGGVGARVEVPASKKDKGADIRTYMLLQDKRALQDSEAMSVRAVQILPDGTLRGIEIRLNEKGTKYEAVAVSQGMNPFIDEEVLGNMDIKVQRGKISAEKRAAYKLSQEEQKKAYDKEATRRRKEAEDVYKSRTGGKASKFSDREYPSGLAERDRAEADAAEQAVEKKPVAVEEEGVTDTEETIDEALASLDNSSRPPTPMDSEEILRQENARTAETEPPTPIQKDARGSKEFQEAKSAVLSQLDTLKARLAEKPGTAPGELSEADLESMTRAEIDKRVQKLYPWATDWMTLTPSAMKEQAFSPDVKKGLQALGVDPSTMTWKEQRTVAIKEEGGHPLITSRTQEALNVASQVMYEMSFRPGFNLTVLDEMLPVMQNLVEMSVKAQADIEAAGIQDTLVSKTYNKEGKRIYPHKGYTPVELTPSIIKQTYLAIYDSDFVKANADAKELVEGMRRIGASVPLDMREDNKKNQAWLRTKIESDALSAWTRGGRDGHGRRAGGKIRFSDAIDIALAKNTVDIETINRLSTQAEKEAGRKALENESKLILAVRAKEVGKEDTIEKQRRAERARSNEGRLKAGPSKGTAGKASLDESVMRLREGLKKATGYSDNANLLGQIESTLGKGVRNYVKQSLDAGVPLAQIDAEIRAATSKIKADSKRARELGTFLNKHEATQKERLFLSEKAKQESDARAAEAARKQALESPPTDVYESEINLEQAEDDTQGELDIKKLLPPTVYKQAAPSQRVTLAEVQEGQKKVDAQVKKLAAAKKKAAKERVKKANSEKEKALLNLAQGRAFASNVGKLINTDLKTFSGYAMEPVSNTTQTIDGASSSARMDEATTWMNDQITKSAEAWIVTQVKAGGNLNNSTLDPTVITELSNTLDMSDPDVGNWAAYVALGKATERRVRWNNKLRFGWWRTSGLDQIGLAGRKKYGQKIVSDAEMGMKGDVQYQIQKATSATLSLAGVLKANKIDLGALNVNQAIAAYLDGMRPASITKKFDVSFPEDAIPHLNSIKEQIKDLGIRGKYIGAFNELNTRVAIDNARPYLSRSVNQKGIEQVTRGGAEAEIAKTASLLAQSMNIPLNQEQAEKMSPRALARIINGLAHYHNMLNKNVEVVGEGGARIKVAAFTNPTTQEVVHFATVKDGIVMTGKGLRAEKQDMIDFILSSPPTNADFEQQVWNVLEASQETERSGKGTTRGLGADRGIQKERTKFKSDYELIIAANKTLKKMAGKDTQVRSRLDAQEELYRTMSFEEYLNEVKTEFPKLEATTKELKLDYAYNKSLRELMREEADAGHLIVNTISKQASAVALSSYLSSVARVGYASGWLSKSDEKGTLVPLAPADAGIADTTFMLPDGEVVRAGDMFVAPEVSESLKGVIGWGKERSGKLVRGMQQISGWQKLGMVIYNSVGQLRNFVSTADIHIAHGGGWDLPAEGRALRLAGKRSRDLLPNQRIPVNESLVDGTQYEKRLGWMFDNMTRLGLLGDGARIGTLKELLATGRREGMTAEGMQEILAEGQRLSLQGMGKVSKGQAGKVKRYASGVWAGVKRFGEGMFTLEDEWIKTQAWEVDAKKHLEWHTGSNELFYKAMDGGTLTPAETKTLEAAMSSAAMSVSDRYPTFSKAAPHVHSISKFPLLGSFPTFAYEVMRTQANHLKYLGMMFNGKTYDGTKVTSAKARVGMKARATALLAQNIAWNNVRAGVVAVTTKGIWGAAAAGAAALGLGDDDDAEKMSESLGSNREDYSGALPWFMEHKSDVAMINIDSVAGTGTIIDSSYGDPWGAHKEELNRMQTELMEAFASDDPRTVEIVMRSLGSSIRNVFLADEILWGAYTKRRNRMSGTIEGYKKDDVSKKLADDVENFLNQWFPRDVGAGVGAAIENNPAKMTLKHIAELVEYGDELYSDENIGIGEVVGDVASATALKVGGVKVTEFNAEVDMPKIIASGLRQLTGANTMLMEGLIYSDAKTYEEFAEDYRHLNSARRRAFDRIADGVHDSVTTFGRTRGQMDDILKEGGITDSANGIDKQQFYDSAYTPPSVEMMRLATIVSTEEIEKRNSLSEERANEINTWYQRARIDIEENKY